MCERERERERERGVGGGERKNQRSPLSRHAMIMMKIMMIMKGTKLRNNFKLFAKRLQNNVNWLESKC